MCSNVSELAACLKEVGRPPDSPDELGEHLICLAAILEQAQVFYVESVAWFDMFGVAKAGGAGHNTQSWLRDFAARSPRQAAGDRRVAQLLHEDGDRPLTATNEALAAGKLTLEQAKLIAEAMHPLEPATITAIEATLVAAVVAADPSSASKLCAHAAELATPHDAAARADRQARKRHLDFHPHGDMVALTGLLEPSEAEAVSATLTPLARPRTDPATPDSKDQRTAGQRRADALVELARRARTDGELPITGGSRPHVNLTIDIDDLRGEPDAPDGEEGTDSGVGRSAGGRPVPGWEARLTCCDADITTYAIRRTPTPRRPSPGKADPHWQPTTSCDQSPVDPVLLLRLLDQIAPSLGGNVLEVLAVGRTRRLVTPAIRKALVLRDKGCAYPGCDRPPDWCECHHTITHWTDGGHTELTNLALVCCRHHALLHKRNETLVTDKNGRWHVTTYRPDLRHRYGIPQPDHVTTGAA